MADGSSAANDAEHVKQKLREKLNALNDAIAVLEDTLLIADPADAPSVQWALDASHDEAQVVLACINTINAMNVQRPGPDAEAALLNAIAAVGALVAGAAAVTGVVTATTNLINAYKA